MYENEDTGDFASIDATARTSAFASGLITGIVGTLLFCISIGVLTFFFYGITR